MKKNKLIKKSAATLLLLVEASLLFPLNTVAATIPKSVVPGSASPGDTVNIHIGDIEPGVLTGVADMVLTMDISRSMRNPFGTAVCTLGTNCRIDVAKDSFKQAVDLLTANSILNREALVTFYGDKTDPAWSTAFETQVPFTNNAATLKNKIDDINRSPYRPGGTGIALGACTAIGGGVQESLDELLRNGRPIPPDYIVLATDGLQNFFPSVYDNNILTNAIARGVKIFTVGIGIDPNFTDEFTYCRTNPGSGGSFIPSGDPASPTDPTRPTRLFDDLNGNDKLDGEDYLMDIAAKTGGTYKNTSNAAEFRTELQNVVNGIKFDYSFRITDIINQTIFRPIDILTDVTYSNCDGTVISPPVIDQGTPSMGFYFDHSFQVVSEPIPVGQKRCIDIRATIKSDAEGVVYGSQFVDSPIGPITDVTKPLFWEKAIPFVRGIPFSDSPLAQHLRIDQANIFILNPAYPWIQTTNGDVGSVGGSSTESINVQRNPTNPAISGHNSEYLVLAKETISNFNSSKSWLINGTDADPYNINLGKFKDFAALKTQLGKVACNVSGSTLPTGNGIFNYTLSAGAGSSADCQTVGPKGASSVIFINGPLTIGSNYIPGKPTIIIASGDITINTSVSRIEATLVSDGKIYTSVGGTNQLTVAGAVLGGLAGINNIAPEFDRDLGADCSGLCNRNNAGQVINLDPKYYYTLTDYAGVPIINYNEERP